MNGQGQSAESLRLYYNPGMPFQAVCLSHGVKQYYDNIIRVP